MCSTTLGTFILAGTTRMRAPDGTPLEAEPFYIEADPQDTRATVAGEMVQAGQIARRMPGGECLPATPIYIEATERTKRGEEAACTDFARFCAKVMGKYLKECEAAGMKV